MKMFILDDDNESRDIMANYITKKLIQEGFDCPNGFICTGFISDSKWNNLPIEIFSVKDLNQISYIINRSN